jgi:integrase
MSKKRNPNGRGSFKKLKDGRVAWRQQVDNEIREISAKTDKELIEKVNKVADLPIIKNEQSVSEWFEKWLAVYIKPLKKKATYDQYRIMYEQHVKNIIGKRKVINVVPYDIQSVIAKANEKGKSTKTMKHIKTVMSGAFARAYKEKYIPINPVKDIEIPIKQAKPRKVLSIKELSKIYKSMSESRWIWAIKFMLVTGVRRGELLALKWTDIDYGNKRITIDKSNSTTGLGDTKSSRIHYIPISDKVKEYLGKQLIMLKKEYNPVALNEDASIIDDLTSENRLVFPAKNGKMINPNTFYHTICRYAGKVGIKASPHCWRHTFVFLSRNKLSLKEIQLILGHDEYTTTLDIYGNMVNETTDKTAKQIDEIFNNVEVEMKKIEEKKNKKDVSYLKRVK